MKAEKQTPTYTPSEKDKQTVKHVMSVFESYKKQSEQYRDDWEKIYEGWRLHLRSNDYPWRSKVYIPLMFWTIETIAPKLLSDNPTISAKAVGEEDELKAEFISKFLDQQFRRTMKMRSKLLTTVKSMLAYGRGIAKVYWETKTVGGGKKAIKGQKNTKRVVYDDPIYEPKSIFDVYVDPKVDHIQESEWVIDYYEKSYNELMKQDDIYKNLKYVKGFEGLSLKDDNNRTQSSVDHLDLSSSASGPKKVKCIEAWCSDKVVTIADIDQEPVLLREMPNPYKHGMKPFVSLKCFDSPEAQRFYTQGFGHILKDIQAGINTTANQTIDNANLVINKMYAIRRGANIDRKQLIARPGGMVEVDDLSDIKEMRTSDISGSSKYLMDQFLYWAQNTTGATDLLRGLSSSATATGLSIQDKNAQSRLTILQANVEEFISEIGKMILDLDQQYIQNTRSIRIFDEQFREEFYILFSEGSLDGEFDIEIESDSTVNIDKAVLNKQLLDSISLFGADPSFGLDKKAVARRWYKNAGFSDIDELLPQKEEEQPENTQEAPLPEQGRAEGIELQDQVRSAYSPVTQR